MRSLWLGWLAVACLTTGARAEGLLAPTAELRVLTDDPALGKADRVNGTEARGVVAFTFDDGPDPVTTPAVLDALEQYDVPATFFIVTRRLVGDSGKRSREILERIVSAGFDLGSHSVSHPDLRKASPRQLAAEIEDSVRTLAPQANRPIGLFRPPFGAFTRAGVNRLARLGLTEVRWSIDPRDWQARDAAVLRATTVRSIVQREGGVVLLHDVQPVTATALTGILDDLEAENCRRLAAAEAPIVPVSLHYFLKNGATRRPVPAPVQARTEAYRARLPARCENRANAVRSPGVLQEIARWVVPQVVVDNHMEPH